MIVGTPDSIRLFLLRAWNGSILAPYGSDGSHKDPDT